MCRFKPFLCGVTFPNLFMISIFVKFVEDLPGKSEETKKVLDDFWLCNAVEDPLSFLSILYKPDVLQDVQVMGRCWLS